MNTMTGQDDRQDAMNEPSDDSPAGEESPKITLDKNVPEIADAFQDCKPGDMYKVESADDMEVVLSKAESPDMNEEEPADDTQHPGGEPRRLQSTPLQLIMAKKAKQ